MNSLHHFYPPASTSGVGKLPPYRAPRGLPDVAVGRTSGFMTDIKNGQEDEISPDLAQLLGRQPARLKQGLKELYRM